MERIHDELQRQLADSGASLDVIYYCPVVLDGTDRTQVDHPDRKPGPGMLLRAAHDLGLDLTASWMVGDLISDALAGYHARCRGSIQIDPEMRSFGEGNARFSGLQCCDDLVAAITLVIEDRIRLSV